MNRLYSTTLHVSETVLPRKTGHVTRRVNANKVSKSEKTKKIEYAYNF